MNFTEPKGHITYPAGNASEYTNNEHVVFTFTANGTNQILVRITRMSLEYQRNCLYDYIAMEGAGHADGKYCGNKSDLSFLSLGKTLTVTFRSDSSISGSGFQLSWIWINHSKCLENTDSLNILSTYNFPLSFPGLISCCSTITVTQNKRILLKVLNMSHNLVTSFYLKADEFQMSLRFKNNRHSNDGNFIFSWRHFTICINTSRPLGDGEGVRLNYTEGNDVSWSTTSDVFDIKI